MRGKDIEGVIQFFAAPRDKARAALHGQFRIGAEQGAWFIDAARAAHDFARHNQSLGLGAGRGETPRCKQGIGADSVFGKRAHGC